MRKATAYVMITYKHSESGHIDTILGNASEFNIITPKEGDNVSFVLTEYEDKIVAGKIHVSDTDLYKDIKLFLENKDITIAGDKEIISLRFSDVVELALKLKIEGTSNEIFTKLRTKGYDYIGAVGKSKTKPASFYFLRRTH